MTNYTKKLGTTIATVAILANGLLPIAFADTNITISGNAENTNNGITVTNVQSTTVTQSNTADFKNDVDGSANTGNNSASHNNGGTVSVTTGDATVKSTVDNSANQNFADVSCCNAGGDTTVKISGNGEGSKNAIGLTQTNSNVISQTNDTKFNNDVDGNANTGKNLADHNNGGNVSVNTGDAKVSSDISNWANGNSAKISPKAGAGMKGSLSVMILDNAEGSQNGVNVALTDAAIVTQSNKADFKNDVDGNANTGNNSASHNNGGSVSVETGDAEVSSSIDNMANFNWADLNCGCLLNGDVKVAISGNGEKSVNGGNVTLVSTQVYSQTNGAKFNNDVDGNGDTGKNLADHNNGGAGNWDPSVDTGDSDTSSEVSNTANLNGIGGNAPEWPSWDMAGVHVTVNFSLNALLAALGL